MYSMTMRDDSKIRSLYLSEDNMYLITLQESIISYWQIYNLSIIFQNDITYPASNLALSKSEKVIAIAEGDTIYIEDNTLRTNEQRIVGRDIGSRHKYMKFIVDTIKNNLKVQYDEDHNH